MSRYSDVINSTNRILTKDKERYGSRTMTNLFLSQISETLALIYDDWFATKIELEPERKDDSTQSQGKSLPCWTDGPDGCEELTYHGMAECLRHCVEKNVTDCRYDCQYVELDSGACLHEYLMRDAADYLDKAAATIEKMKKANIVIAAERKDDGTTAD